MLHQVWILTAGVSIERTPSSGSDKNVGIDNINKGSTKKTNGVNDAVDGIGSSKPKLKEDGGQESVSSKGIYNDDYFL